MEMKKALLITDQEVPSIKESVPRPEDILQQLPLGQFWSPSVAQKRGLLAHGGHQQPWLTWKNSGVRSELPSVTQTSRPHPASAAKSNLACQLHPNPSTNLELWPHNAPGHSEQALLSGHRIESRRRGRGAGEEESHAGPPASGACLLTSPTALRALTSLLPLTLYSQDARPTAPCCPV